jgi:hypothetical protein
MVEIISRGSVPCGGFNHQFGRTMDTGRTSRADANKAGGCREPSKHNLLAFAPLEEEPAPAGEIPLRLVTFLEDDKNGGSVRETGTAAGGDRTTSLPLEPRP